MMKMPAQLQPLVSIIMPVRNGRHFIGQAIESILAQTYKNFEFLIVDDASTDSTWDILKAYKDLYPKIIKVYKLKKNKGAYGAANFLLKRVLGRFIALMDSDDISHPARIEKQLEYMLRHKDVIVLGTQVNIINETGRVIGNKVLPTCHDKIYQDFAIVHPMVHPSCMINLKKIPGEKFFYRIKFGVNDDYYTFFELLRYGKFANLDEVLLSYRIHLQNSSLRNLKEKFFNTVKIRLCAVKEFGYHVSIRNWLMIFSQTIFVYLTPEKYITIVYLYCRGIYSLRLLYEGLRLKMKLLLLKQVRYLLNLAEYIW